MPPLALRKSAAMLKSVVLPAPFGPSRPNSDPVGIANETRSSASTCRPNHFVSSSADDGAADGHRSLLRKWRVPRNANSEKKPTITAAASPTFPRSGCRRSVFQPQGVSWSSQVDVLRAEAHLEYLMITIGTPIASWASASAANGDATAVLIQVQSARYGRLKTLIAAQP